MLLLAFFIVLVALSNFEAKKARTVIESVKGALSEPGFLDDSEVRPVVPDAANADAPLDVKIRKLFEDRFQLLELENLKTANGLRAEASANDLFYPESPKIKEEVMPFLKQIVETLLDEKPAQDNLMEVFLPSPPFKRNANAGQIQTVSMARGGALARLFLSLGLPKDRFAAGLRNGGNVDKIEFFFYIVPENRPQLDFTDYMLEKQQKEQQ